MGQAPSEKHLEDYIWSHPEALGVYDLPPQWGGKVQIYKLWFRQLHLPSGIADLVGVDYRLLAFELKKGTLTAQALTQLMRYMFDLKWMMSHFLSDCRQQDEPFRTWAIATDPMDEITERHFGGVLIGHTVEDDNLLLACELIGIDVILYDFSEGQYQFVDPFKSKVCDTDWRETIHRTLWDSGIARKMIAYFSDDMMFEFNKKVVEHNKNYNAAQESENYINSLDGES